MMAGQKGNTVKKLMPYRVYKKQFPDCKTLDDYDKVNKTITVLIPDDDSRIKKNPRIDSKIWKSYGNEWRLRLPGNPDGCAGYSVRKCESGYYAICGFEDAEFPTREEALEWVRGEKK